MSKQKSLSVYVDEDYLNLIPRPNDEQYEALKQSIQKQGLLEPIKVNSDGMILDGHTRFEICEELGIPVRYVVKSFNNDEDQKLYAITTNLKRRHLNDFQIVELLEKELYNIKAENRAVEYSELTGCKKKKGMKKSEMGRIERSPFYEVSKTIGVNPVKIEHILRVKQNCDAKTIQDVREGKLSLARAIKAIEIKHSDETRAKYMKDKILQKRLFAWCPFCGTMTLESFYKVKEIHCTKCDYYYDIKRRHH